MKPLRAVDLELLDRIEKATYSHAVRVDAGPNRDRLRLAGTIESRQAKTGAGQKVWIVTETGREIIKAYRQLKRGTKVVSGPMIRKFGHTVPSTDNVPLEEADIVLLRERARMAP